MLKCLGSIESMVITVMATRSCRGECESDDTDDDDDDDDHGG